MSEFFLIDVNGFMKGKKHVSTHWMSHLIQYRFHTLHYLKFHVDSIIKVVYQLALCNLWSGVMEWSLGVES